MPLDPVEPGFEESAYAEGRQMARNASEASPISLGVLAILKRPWITVLSLFGVVVPTLFYLYTREPLYRSSAVVSIAQSPVLQEIGYAEARLPGAGDESEYLYTSILESNAYYEFLSAALIAARPEFASSPDSAQRMVRSAVSYSSKPRAPGFLIISAQWTTPEIAQLLATKALEGFQQISKDLRRQETSAIAGFIEQQLDEVNRNMADIEVQIQTFLRDRGLTLDETSSGIDSDLKTLEKSLATAQAQRDLAKLQIDTYTTEIKERLSQYMARSAKSGEAEHLKSLRSQYAALDTINYDSLGRTDSLTFFKYEGDKKHLLAEMIRATSGAGSSSDDEAGSPRVSLKILEEELDGRFLEYQRQQIGYQYFKSQVDEFLRSHPDLPRDILEFYNLNRTRTVLLKTNDILVETREKTRIKMASESGGIKVIDQPNRPRGPVAGNRGMKLLGAIFGSLVFGAMISFVIDFFDNTVQGEGDIQARFNLPVYGSIPVLDEKSRSSARKRSGRSRKNEVAPANNGFVNPKLLNNYSETSPVAEAYRSIKTALLFTVREKNQNAFVITSPVASDGKSLTTYNLAASFAQGGKKVLIIDADLRRSSQHKLVGVAREPGLTDCLYGKCTSEAAVVPTGSPNLSLLPAGMRASNPAELVSSHSMRQFLEEITTKYDLILIDSPPITPCMDSRHLATMTAGIIMVVRAESTKLNVLDHCISVCRRVNAEILGVIVNHAAFRYGYSYYYLYQRYNPYGYYYSGYQYYYTQDPDSGERQRKKKRKSYTHSYDSDA